MKFLWEILVPCVRNDGRPFRLRYHRVWDAKVREISGGLTIMKPARGQWVDPHEGQLYEERMIPVRFVATREQMEEIVDMTCVYYEQLAVLCYRIADEVVMRDLETATNNVRRRKMQMFDVTSSNIAAIGHEDGKLRVQFNNGSVYEYDGVSVDMFEDLGNAGSVGQFFNAHIKDQFVTTRIS